LPPEYGPYTTVFNRWNRWSQRGLWQRIFAALVACADPPRVTLIDSSAVKAHRSAPGARNGATAMPAIRRSAARAAGAPPSPTRSVTTKPPARDPADRRQSRRRPKVGRRPNHRRRDAGLGGHTAERTGRGQGLPRQHLRRFLAGRASAASPTGRRSQPRRSSPLRPGRPSPGAAAPGAGSRRASRRCACASLTGRWFGHTAQAGRRGLAHRRPTRQGRAEGRSLQPSRRHLAARPCRHHQGAQDPRPGASAAEGSARPRPPRRPIMGRAAPPRADAHDRPPLAANPAARRGEGENPPKDRRLSQAFPLQPRPPAASARLTQPPTSAMQPQPRPQTHIHSVKGVPAGPRAGWTAGAGQRERSERSGGAKRPRAVVKALAPTFRQHGLLDAGHHA